MQERMEWFDVVKGVLLALAVSVLSAVVFAVLLRQVPLSESVIYTVNQVIKGVCIVLGVLAFVRGEKGWLKGGLTAILFTALSYLVFSAIGGGFSLSWIVVLEIVIACLIGGVSGILAVNFQEK